MDVRKYFEDKLYFTNYRWTGKRGDTLEEKEETEGVSEVLGTKEISQDQRGQQDIGGTEGLEMFVNLPKKHFNPIKFARFSINNMERRKELTL